MADSKIHDIRMSKSYKLMIMLFSIHFHQCGIGVSEGGAVCAGVHMYIHTWQES